MSSNQPQQNENPFDSARRGVNVGLALCRTCAFSLEVFLHKNMGRRYPGLQAAAVLLLILFYMLAWEGHDLRPMLAFVVAYIVMCGMNRIGSLTANRKAGHTYYTGWPRLMRRCQPSFEVSFKRYVEPLLMLATGFMVREEFNAPLGTYLMIGAVCLFVSVSVWILEERVRADDISDQIIEQTSAAGRAREMRGGD